jgi:hypothetical protein
MRPRAIPFSFRANAVALGLGLAIVGLAAGLAHPETTTVPTRPAAIQAASPVPTAPNFVCHAQPGTWCDLRDWTGFGQPDVK